MTIDREIIDDLMPLYRSGLASLPTRRLIEQWLREQGAEPEEEDAGDNVGTDAGLATFLRTKRLLRCQRWLYGLAIGFTVLSFTSQARIEGGRLVSARLLALAYPVQFAPIAATAFLAWTGYFWLKSRLR